MSWFGAVAEQYAQFRPQYPDALFEFLGTLAGSGALAWDCGTGNGQAARRLAEHFETVVATDVSWRQLSQAPPQPGVYYAAASAEAPALPGGCFDLVLVAQALHWFDREAFFRAVQRVLRPGGYFVALCYARVEVAPEVDPVLQWFYESVVGPYWPPERRWVDEGYRSIALPFPELAAPALTMRAEWDRTGLLGYIATWSALRRMGESDVAAAIKALEEALAGVWGPAERSREVRWPLALKLGRKPLPSP